MPKNYFEPSTYVPSQSALPSREIMDFVFRYGCSSTSFLTLYGGFKYFRKHIREQEGIIAYVDTPTAWVGAADPASPAEIQGELLFAFLAAARKKRGAGIILPISKEIAELARKAGHYAVQIGSEPWFSLDADSMYSFNVAKRLASKGAVVKRFDPIQLTAREFQELDDITEAWLSERPSVPLSFLNRVEPWLYVQHKRFYRIIYQERTVGFLAAVPVVAKNGWYLVDLIRRPDAPVGATELLIAQAIEDLKKEGASEVTLGMSPLASVTPEEMVFHPWTYQLFEWIYRKADFLYSFQTLFEYKEKLKPTRWEPLYLIASPRMGLRANYGLFRALFPAGVIATSFSVFLKKAQSFRIENLFARTLSLRIVPRSPPKSMGELAFRCKTVLLLATAQLLFFFIATDQTGRTIRHAMETRYGYSLQRFINSGVNPENIKALLLSPFLHENVLHLVFNLVTLVFFAGFLELVAGSTMVSICYLLGILFSNPVTSIALYPMVGLLSPAFLQTFTQSVDVGCSLGVFACIGALIHFIRRPRLTFWVLTLLIILSSAIDIKLLDVNHIAAMGIGLVFSRYYVPKFELEGLTRGRD